MKMRTEKFVLSVILLLCFTDFPGVWGQSDQDKNSACQDEYPDGCSIEVGRCSSNDPEILGMMRQMCPVTCSMCNTVGGLTSNQINEEILEDTKTIESSTLPCEDRYTRCVTLKSVCGSSKLFRETHCRKTCDQCTPQSTTPKKLTTAATTISTLLETPTVTADDKKVCEDKFESCTHSEIQRLCKVPKHIGELRELCAKTCGFCSVCEDKYPETCRTQKETCTVGDAETVESMRILCPATCGTCGEKSLPKEQQCEDKYPETCQAQKEACTVGDAESVETMRLLCPVTCNTCGKESPSKNQNCVDKYPERCPQQMEQCMSSNEETKESMRRLCPITCGTCEMISQTGRNTFSTTESFTSSPTPGKDCVDQYPETCLQQIRECTSEDAETKQIMHRRCPVTCGTCDMKSLEENRVVISTTTLSATDSAERTAPSCTNEIPDETCWKYRKLCIDISNDWKDLCRATCGTCGENTTSYPTVPFPTTLIATNSPTSPQPNVDIGVRIESKSECRDLIKECPLHPHLCSIESSGWKDACLVTCNTCNE